MIKLIKVYLDKHIPEEDLWKCCFTVKSLKNAIDNDEDTIVTTQTHAISSALYNKGYDIELIYNGGSIKFSDILADKYSEFFREIRLTHNWEKMFYAGIFYVPDIFEFEV